MDKEKRKNEIMADFSKIAKLIEEAGNCNNKMVQTMVKEYIPGAEGVANNYVSEAGMLLFKKSTETAKETIDYTKNITRCLQKIAECAGNVAKAELRSMGYKVN